MAHGLARAQEESVGRRGRTVYSITRQGRLTLAAWLEEPGEGPVLEFEQLLKLTFAEHGTKRDALVQLAAARAWAEERNKGNLEAARAYATGQGPYQHRAAQNMLGGAFLTDFYRLVARWADWATSVVQTWPDDASEAIADAEAMREIRRRAEWR